MPSDESTCANILASLGLTDHSQTNVEKQEKWAIRLIGNFVLNLYHRQIITPNDDWCVKKSVLHIEYSQFVTTEKRRILKEITCTDDIETLLHRYGYICPTTCKSINYEIRYKTLFDFRKEKLTELDNMKIKGVKGFLQYQGTAIQRRINRYICPTTCKSINYEIRYKTLFDFSKEKLTELDNMKIKGVKGFLQYQGTAIQRRINSFNPNHMSCYICEENFTTMKSFEEHIQIHSEDEDFVLLGKSNERNSPIFNISYEHSKTLSFKVTHSKEDLIIEKIIIVQSRSFFYVDNNRVTYISPKRNIKYFSVDPHLFTRHVEQPIILICHLEGSKESRIIEQHNFMSSEKFPKINSFINKEVLNNNKTFQPKLALADYLPPKEIQEALKGNFYHAKLMTSSNEFRNYVNDGKSLQPQTIADSLSILLQIEDMDTVQEYPSIWLKITKLCGCDGDYSFNIASNQYIMENTFSVFDEIILARSKDIFHKKRKDLLELMTLNKSDIHRTGNMFVGVIQDVNKGRISFKCDQNIDIHGSYTVICRPSRLNFRYQYRSLDLLPTKMDFLKKFLFPTKIIPMPLSTISLNLYNKNINTEQLQAVRNIAEGPRNDATYVIFGPPGTGKTTTLVESILQVLRKPNTKIVVTASSNSACDEVALKLCKYLNQLDIKRAMVRIYSRSSEVRTDTIDDELLENSNMYNGQFYPDVEILHEYRVVICTLSIVGKLATGEFGRKENGVTLYTHLFIDEVAASTEIEALVALTTVLTPKSCLIISGDHKQLGPILQSKRAKELGLDVSLMDRLLARDCYRVDVVTGDYDRTIQTRLVRNYRSHPAIVNLYSSLYYNNSLEAFAKPDDVSLCEIWHKWSNKQYPILFHAVYEPSKSVNRSHSLYNLKELDVVMEYVKDIIYFGINGEPVNESDIGIISPYKTQYTHIREELNLRKWFNIETGSVETFQGKEKNIIIVSFVRSGTKNLGFLNNPRRLNVTLSRPKSLLILIGNPKTLSLNSDFEYIIKECQRNNTFIGGNDTSRGNLIQQSTGDLVMSEEKLFQLNRTIQTPNINHEDQKNDTKTVQRNRQQGQNRRRNNFNNNEESNKENYVQRDVDIKDDDKNEREDEEDYKNNKTNATAWDAINFSNIEKSRNGYEVRQSQNDVAATGGVISKQHSRGGQKNQNLDKYNIDAIIDELPPKFLENTSVISVNSNDNNDSKSSENKDAFRNTVTSDPAVDTLKGKHNLPPSMKDEFSENNSAENSSSKSTGAAKKLPKIAANIQVISSNSRDKTSSNSTESRDEFKKTVTVATAAVDTLKYNRDTLIDLQPLNYCEPTFSINKNLSCFKNANSNNAAEDYRSSHISKANVQSSSAADSKVIAEKNNLPSTMEEDNLGENFSDKLNFFNSAGTTKQPPQIIGITSGIAENSCDKTISNSTERKDAFTTAGAAPDTLK